MSVENEAPPTKKGPLLDLAAYKAASRVYSHQEFVIVSDEDVSIVFGTGSHVEKDADGYAAFMPHTVCFMTSDHFREFAKLVNEQVKKLEEESE